jgi:hypothetical protein
VEREGGGYRVHTKSAASGLELTFDVDDVIAATGFVSPLRDLPALGVATFGQSRIPAQTPFWQSATVPGIYFAGTIMQGAQGMRKHGIPSNSGAVQGYRYNARVLARHIAEERFGHRPAKRQLKEDEVVPFLLAEVSRGPELWHQRSYLARVVAFDPDAGITDEGIQPLAHFVDGGAAQDAAAIALEANGKDDPYPAVYVRRGGKLVEHLMAPQPLLDFEGPDYQSELSSVLSHVLGKAPARSTS